MTVSGARQHLTALVDDGLAEVARGRRAPRASAAVARLAYTVSDRADGLFPKAYGELTNELLGYVADTDTALVDTLFERRRDERIRNATAATRPAAGTCGEGRRARAHPRRRRVPRDVRGDRPAGTASSSTTARSGPSPSATARRARARSTSSAPSCRRPTVERVQHMVAGAPHCRVRGAPSRRLGRPPAEEQLAGRTVLGRDFRDRARVEPHLPQQPEPVVARKEPGAVGFVRDLDGRRRLRGARRRTR